MARRKWTWTPKQLDKLSKVIAILDELEDYKPLTLRQVYYQLVSKEYIENTVSQYGMLSNLLKWARIDGHVSWSDIEDRVRTFHGAEGWLDKRSFINSSLDSYLEAYKRNLWQTQQTYVEVWIEKDALSSVFTRACSPYGVSVVVCRGFSSVSFLHRFSNRVTRHDSRHPVMLYFGDFDPSGIEMLAAMKTTLQTEMDVAGIEFKRIALIRDDISNYNLPNNPNAVKKSDTRTKKHVEVYGEFAVELDALRPDVLMHKIEGAIESEITDRGAYNNEVSLYNLERGELKELKKRIMVIIAGDQEREVG